MDTTVDIRKKIHAFIDHADERMLKIINAIIMVDESEEQQSKIPESFFEELDERREKHLKGESKSYTWSETKDRARGALK